MNEFSDHQVVWVQAKDKDKREYDVKDFSYWIVPYPLFRRDASSIEKIDWDIVIADEAQEFRSTKSKTRDLVLSLNRTVSPRYRWALTGTPIANKLEDLYSILYWVDKSFLPPWPVFEKRHIVRNQFKEISGYKNLKSLNLYLPQRMDRKRQRDMEGNLPKIRSLVHMIQKDKDYETNEKILLATLNIQAKKIRFTKTGQVVGQARSKKIARALHKTREQLASDRKLTYLVENIRSVLDSDDTNRIVVFSFYKEPLYKLSTLLSEHSIESVEFTGDQSADEKRAAIEEFKEGTRVLLSSNAGARGLDLPFANHLYHIDVPFSFETIDQRNKRITRLSSKTDSVIVNYLLLENSIEHYFYEQVMKKGALSDAVLDGGKDKVTVKAKSLRQHIKKNDDRGTTKAKH